MLMKVSFYPYLLQTRKTINMAPPRKYSLKPKQSFLQKFIEVLYRIGQPIYLIVGLGLIYFLAQFSLSQLHFRVPKYLYALLSGLRKFFLQLFRHPVFRWSVSVSVSLAIVSFLSWNIYQFVFADLPLPSDIFTQQPLLTTKIYDRHGKELYNIYKEENRTLIKLDELPEHVVQATLAIEDAYFYQHPGFSIRGIIRAVRNNFFYGQIQGGSTITQQLVKNTLLSSEKKYKRKVREVFLAILVEALYSKEEILEMYFNQIPYGGTTYGIEEAAQQYFGKSAKTLSLSEAALLVGIPAAPSAYSPFGSHPELSVQRQHEVIRRMVDVGFITQEASQTAMEEKLTFLENRTPIQAPHFVMYVRSLLAETYGEGMVSQGGLEIYTSLDLDFQNQVQQIVSDEVKTLEKFRISNGAALVTNPGTGEVLAMVGSTNYFDIQHDGQVNVTIRERQPGSSIKPLTYALALERGYTPTSMIEDTPVSYQFPGSPPYQPKNYDGQYHGRVTLRQALANSYNIPAVRLAAALGVPQIIDKGEIMGITTWKDRQRYGLSITLGGAEVKMVDMAKLYGTFANQGESIDLNPILLIKNAKGEVLYQNQCVTDHSKCFAQKTLDARVAQQITDILSDNQARSGAFGTNSVLHIPNQQVAVKTGTTNSLRDNWTIGYTSERLAAVWVGNNDNTPMSYVASGITGASPIWNKIIRTQLSDETPHVFQYNQGLKKVAICVPTGTLTCNGCPQVREEYFIPGTEPTKTCSSEMFRKTN